MCVCALHVCVCVCVRVRVCVHARVHLCFCIYVCVCLSLSLSLCPQSHLSMPLSRRHLAAMSHPSPWAACRAQTNDAPTVWKWRSLVQWSNSSDTPTHRTGNLAWDLNPEFTPCGSVAPCAQRDCHDEPARACGVGGQSESRAHSPFVPADMHAARSRSIRCCNLSARAHSLAPTERAITRIFEGFTYRLSRLSASARLFSHVVSILFLSLLAAPPARAGNCVPCSFVDVRFLCSSACALSPPRATCSHRSVVRVVLFSVMQPYKICIAAIRVVRGSFGAAQAPLACCSVCVPTHVLSV